MLKLPKILKYRVESYFSQNVSSENHLIYAQNYIIMTLFQINAHLRKGVLLWQKTKDSMILQSTGIRCIEVFSSPFNGRQWLEGQ